MSGIGFQELLLLFLIGLVVLGPERLPRVANQLGSWLGQARRMTRMMKRQLEEELDVEQGLGLKSIGKQEPPGSVQQPRYVHDRPGAADKPPGAPDEKPASADLPDDYSPAHGPGEAGSGVGDDEDHADDDEREPSGRPERTAADEPGEGGDDKPGSGT